MRIVVGARFLFGHRDLVHDLVLLDLLPDHLSFQVLPQIGQRQALLFEGGLECFLAFELVLGLDALEDGREPRVGEGVTELLAALHDEHLVQRLDQKGGRDLIEHLSKLRVVRVALQVDLLTLHFPEPRNLPVLQVGFREDLAVHLDEDLFDDFRARRAPCDRQSDRGGRRLGR